MKRRRTFEGDALVLGAGMAGLAAARRLHAAGLQVRVLEARPRTGGRAATEHAEGLNQPIELGAEFIHGEQPITFALAREAGLSTFALDTHQLCGDAAGRLVDCGPRFTSVFDRLRAGFPTDEAFSSWLARQALDADERAAAIAYVEGFYAAHVDRASVQAIGLAEEAAARPGAGCNHRLEAGYGALADWLAADLPIDLETPVEHLRWSPVGVEAIAGARRFAARRAIVALPLAALQRERPRFDPPLPHQADLHALEMGDVCKLVLRFRSPEALQGLFSHPRFPLGAPPPDCFLHLPGAEIPTWWMAWKGPTPLLVAWAGGQTAADLLPRAASAPEALAIEAAATLFGTSPDSVREALAGVHFHDWSADPFIGGAYSWHGVGGLEAQRRASAPVADTLYFAGEWTDAEDIGTVEAALRSGDQAAEQLLRAAACDPD